MDHGDAFERDGVDAVEDGGEEGQAVAEDDLAGGFFGEGVGAGEEAGALWGGVGVGVVVVVDVAAGEAEVDVGDEEDAEQGGDDAEELAEGEFLGAGEGAEEEGPDGGGGGEDCG